MDEFFIDRYRVTAVLGRGGHGTVYLGFDEKLDRDVAIKVLNPELTSDADAVARFNREARAIAKLHHPNILELYDFSVEGSPVSYMVTERLLGDNLNHLLEQRNKPLPVGIAAGIVHEVCLGLGHAHERNLVHRDLKPENIFVEKQGRVVLCDFGIARALKIDGVTSPGAHTQLVGSPLFMAPEQINGLVAVSPATDLWSLGTVLYFLASNRNAFIEESVLGVFKRIVEGAHHPFPSTWPKPFAQLVKQCLSVDPKARPKNASALAKVLAEIAAGAGFADPRQAARALGDEVTGPHPTQITTLNDLSAEERTVITKIARTTGNTTIAGPTRAETQTTARRRETQTNIAAYTTTRSHNTRRLPWVVAAILLLGLAGAGAAVFLRGDAQPLPPDPGVPVHVPPPQPVPTLDTASLPEPAAPPTVVEPPPPAPSEPAPTPARQRPVVVAPPAQKASGSLRLIALPWAEVSIDGSVVGTTPAFRTMTLSAGKHRMKLSNPNFRTQEKDFVIEPDRELKLVFNLDQ